MADSDLTLDIGDVSGPGRVGEILIRPISSGDNGTYWQSDHAGRIPLKYNDPDHASTDPAYDPSYTVLGEGKWEPVKQGAFYEFTVLRVNSTTVNESFTAQIPNTATANFSDLIPTVPPPVPAADLDELVTDLIPGPSDVHDALKKNAWAFTRGGRKVSLLGASITANNGNSSLVANPGGSNPSGWLDYGIVTWANMVLGQPMEIVANVAQGGLTSAQILANTSAALATSPNYVIGHDWWINDILNGVSLATSKANHLAIIALCNAAGATTILTDYPGLDAETTTAMKVQHAQMVAWLESIQGPGFLFVPICDAIVEIATGRPESWATYDGTHPSVRGAHALGERLAEYLRPLFPNAATQPRSTNSYLGGIVGGSPYELMGNPMITGTPVGGMAPNFSMFGTGTPTGSVVAATDFTNLKWQRITLTTDGYAVLTPALVTGAGLTYGSTTIVPGTDRTQMQFEFRMPSVSAAGKWACVTAYQYYTPASNTIYTIQDTDAAGTDQGLVPDDNAIFLARGPAAVVPTGTTALNDVIIIYGQAGAVIDVRRVSVAIKP